MTCFQNQSVAELEQDAGPDLSLHPPTLNCLSCRGTSRRARIANNSEEMC